MPFYFNPRSPHGERQCINKILHRYINFNPRSPHGERQTGQLATELGNVISIHAPRTGSDGVWSENVPMALNFNPRSPHGERRGRIFKRYPRKDFNPRSPHGERRYAIAFRVSMIRISIHAPRTGSDVPSYIAKFLTIRISIHAPRTGSDVITGKRFNTFIISIHAPRTGSDLHYRKH